MRIDSLGLKEELERCVGESSRSTGRVVAVSVIVDVIVIADVIAAIAIEIVDWWWWL